MKYVKWIIKSLLLAFIMLFITNIIGIYVNIHIPINIWTIIIAALFRIPGIIVLIIFFLL